MKTEYQEPSFVGLFVVLPVVYSPSTKDHIMNYLTALCVAIATCNGVLTALLIHLFF